MAVSDILPMCSVRHLYAVYADNETWSLPVGTRPNRNKGIGVGFLSTSLARTDYVPGSRNAMQPLAHHPRCRWSARR